VKGHHRRQGSSVAFRVVTSILALAVVGGAGVGGWYGYHHWHQKKVTADCGPTVELSVAAAPEITQAVTKIADGWNAARTSVNGSCVRIEVTPAASADIAATIAGGAGATVTGVGKPNGGTDEPDVWIPDSSMWLQRLQGASSQLKFAGTSIASSPVVLALPVPVAAQLAKAGTPLTIASLLAKLASGTVRPGIVDPNSDSSGLAALLAVGAAAGGASKPESLTVATPQQQAAVVGALRALAAGESRVRDDLMSRFPRAADAASVARALTLAPLPEQAVLAYDAARPPVPLVGAYLNPGPEALDYPFTTVGDLAATKAAAARRFEAMLTGDAWRKVLAAAGLRAADGTFDAATMPKLPGMPAGPFPTTPAVPGAAIDQALSMWSAVTVPGRMLAVIDVSGSMVTPVPSAGGASREQVTVKAAKAGLGLFNDQWEVGLWTFSTFLDGAKDYKQLVPIGPLAVNRADLAEALPTIQPIPTGATGLYDTVLAAYKQVQKGWDPSRVNSVVIMTDGANDDPVGLTIDQLLAQLHTLADPARPVEVIMIGIGTDVNKSELTRIATATGGGAFVTSDASKIGEIFLQAIALRPGTAK
jgi:hypothetical protein